MRQSAAEILVAVHPKSSRGISRRLTQDRCLSRMSAKPKDRANESEDQKKARKTAEELKASVNKMSNSERVSWYRQEKRKRQSETKRPKKNLFDCRWQSRRDKRP